jgi:hypothetical protein
VRATQLLQNFRSLANVALCPESTTARAAFSFCLEREISTLVLFHFFVAAGAAQKTQKAAVRN